MDTSSKLDPNTPHSARVWNFWVGGKDNFAADRAVGDAILEVLPDARAAAVADRAFLVRAVTFLAGEAGIRQFLDVGTGLPTADNTHEVAQRVAPESRIVYVDNDPMVLVHARALLTGNAEGRTDYIDADAQDPDTILREAAETLDFHRPVAVMMLGILQFILDTQHAQRVVRRLLDAVPAGSYLALAHPISGVSEPLDQAVQAWNEQGKDKQTLRTRDEVASFFDGLELLPPGIVPCPRWRPDGTEKAADLDVAPWRVCGVGRKP